MALPSERDRDVAAVDAPSGRLAGAPGGTDAAETTAALHHVHLPALEAAGLVEYDARSGTVRYQDPPVVAALLDAPVDGRAPD